MNKLCEDLVKHTRRGRSMNKLCEDLVKPSRRGRSMNKLCEDLVKPTVRSMNKRSEDFVKPTLYYIHILPILISGLLLNLSYSLLGKMS